MQRNYQTTLVRAGMGSPEQNGMVAGTDVGTATNYNPRLRRFGKGQALLFVIREETWKLVIEVCAEVRQREERGELEESGSALPCGMGIGRL